jgi:Zn-dependent peptidase ImmA (M78 family)
MRKKNVSQNAKRRQCKQKTTEKMNRNANASAKSKELQPDTQADTVAAHLLLPQPHIDRLNRL